MIRSRFSTYYRNHPETYDLSVLTNTFTDQARPVPIAKADQMKISETSSSCTDCEYFQKCVESKVEKALLCLQRSTYTLQNLVSSSDHGHTVGDPE